MVMLLTRLASDATSFAVGSAMAALAALRRGKAVHPFGEVYRGRLVVPGNAHAPRASTLLAHPGEYQAIVRFSRSLGLPRPLPDLLGMSLRICDAYESGAHQDFLMVTSVDLPILHHIFLPADDVAQRPYSSSLPYRAGDETFIVGAVPGSSSGHFDLSVASVGGRFRPVAQIHILDRMPDEADAMLFNPWNTGGGLEPSGLLNRWRRTAYPMSQRVWTRAQGVPRARAAS